MGIIIKDLSELGQICRQLKESGKTIITTNGVFDLLHVGHISYLEFCKKQGDIFIVGVNADSSVRQYKGDKRPIVPEDDRAVLIASLACVDYVQIFSERTPESWLDIVRPDIHIKAGDYTLDRAKETPKTKIYERDVVEKYGGRCMLAPLVQGKSTSAIIQKIIEVYGKEDGACPNVISQNIHNANNDGRHCKRPAAFLDRDGTIISDKEYMHKIEDLQILPGAIDGLQKLKAAGYSLVIITNQSGIARGKFNEDDYDTFNNHFLKMMGNNGIKIDAVYRCPHHPNGNNQQYSIECKCRKPKTGMILDALSDHNLDLKRSVVIGDKNSDVALGNILGIKSVLVKTGKGGTDKECSSVPDHVAKDLSCAAQWIINNR